MTLFCPTDSHNLCSLSWKAADTQVAVCYTSFFSQILFNTSGCWDDGVEKACDSSMWSLYTIHSLLSGSRLQTLFTRSITFSQTWHLSYTPPPLYSVCFSSFHLHSPSLFPLYTPMHTSMVSGWYTVEKLRFASNLLKYQCLINKSWTIVHLTFWARLGVQPSIFY